MVPVQTDPSMTSPAGSVSMFSSAEGATASPSGEGAALLSRRAILEAQRRIRPHAHRTPVLRSGTFDRRFGAELYFKCENFQKIGAFKFRGAMNAVAQLSAAQLARGVTTHSSGNHAQALSLAARIAGAPARVVMPRTAPAVKVAAVRGYGAEITFCEPTLAAREAESARIIEATGAVLIHPYNDRRVIAGQATAAKELIEDSPPLDLLLPPLGGGGLTSGTALCAHHFSPGTAVVAIEPAGADDGLRSFAAGRLLPGKNPRTIADGLLSDLCELTFSVIRRHVQAVVSVEDDEIVAAMRLLFERLKIVVEPSAAVPFAAVLAGKVDVAGKKVGIILSGGNVDLDTLPWIAQGEGATSTRKVER